MSFKKGMCSADNSHNAAWFVVFLSKRSALPQNRQVSRTFLLIVLWAHPSFFLNLFELSNDVSPENSA